MNHDSELIDLLVQLVQIDSINPDLVPGARGEGEIAAFLAAWAESVGLEATLSYVKAGRPNVTIVARGSGGGRNLMFNGHTDTVGTTGMREPFAATIRGDRMYGRGAYDMKAGLAASLIAAKRAKAFGLRGDVIVTCVIDEEVASLGSEAVVRDLERWQPDAVLVAEPTEQELVLAHRGFAWYSIETIGLAAHGSRPHLGVDAIAQMGKVLVGLSALDRDMRARPSHPLLGSGSLHASLIQGGQEMSSYPAECVLQLERRTVPGETPELVQAQFQALLDQYASADPTFQAILKPGLGRGPFEQAADSWFVRVLQAQIASVAGQPAPISGASYWADSALFAEAGLPTVLFGPIGAGAHAAEEWVDLPSTIACAEIYTTLAREICA